MKLGVIGGLGPMATAYFMELVIKMTKASCDQEHLEMIIYNCPSIPDRTAYILGQSNESPLPAIVEYAEALKKQQVDCIAIPCITAHYFHKEIQEQAGIKVIHTIQETAKTLKAAGISRVGIMATDGTIQSGIFQKEIENHGMEAALPDAEMQKMVMSLIYENVKAGKEPDMEKFFRVRDWLKEERKAQVIILGCTELSVIKRDCEIGEGFIDAMEVLAKSSILSCKKEVKAEYETLFSAFEE